MMKESGDALKIRILDGAAALFIEKGIDNVTTRELTEHLGLSRSHIYHYFSDWQTLCVAALARYTESELETFSTALVGMAPADQLEAMIANYLPDAPDAVWLLYSSLWQRAVHHKAYAALAESVIDKWVALTREIFAAGTARGDFRVEDSARVARQFSAMLYGYADTLIINPSAEKYREAVSDIRAFIRLVV